MEQGPKKPRAKRSDGAEVARKLAEVRRPGRKLGAMNKETKAKLNATRKGIAMALETGVSPLEVMLRAMRGENIPPHQVKWAVEAAPYVHPKLNAVAYRDVTDRKDMLDLRGCTAEQLAVLREVVTKQRALPAPDAGQVIEGTAEEDGDGDTLE